MIGLALTFVAIAASASASGYLDGREYVYQYTGFISTGFPGIKPQQSGYTYNTRLRIQSEGERAIFKVEAPQRAQFNGEFEDVTQAEHTYTDLPEHAEFLTRPFRVYRKNGVVTHFEASRDEPSFSVNLKRGLASLFNLHLDHAQSEEPHPHAPHYYKLYEESVVGECETAYVIEHHPYDRTHDVVLNVTKLRNFNKCNRRPDQLYSVFPGHQCGEVDHQKAHPLHGNGHSQYSIRGDRHQYVIEEIRTESDTSYPLEGQTVSTLIRRSLSLLEEKAVSEPIQLPDDLVDHASLVYDFDYQKDFRDPVDLKKPHYLYHLTGRKVPVADIRQQVEELVDAYHDDTYAEKVKDEDFPAKFVELLRSVATVGYDEIDALYRAYADIPESGATEQQQLYRSLFFDTLVNSGTNPAFLYGKHLIDDRKLRESEALYFVRQLQFHLKDATQTLLDTLQELCDSEYFKTHPTTLHVACVDTLGNIVFDHCVAHHHPEGVRVGKHECPYDAAVKYFNYIAGLYEQADSDQLKAYYVKAAGNVGVREILPYIEPYIEGRTRAHRFYRDNAIRALKNLGHRYPEKVRSLLVPLLFNRTEHYELRLSAFVLLLQQRPELHEIEAVAWALKHDTDDQVRSFVYSTFESLAHSTHPCDTKLSKQAHYALRILEDVHHEFEHYDYTYSKHHYFAGYDPDYDFGGSTRFAYYASDTGYFPRMLHLGLEDYIGGQSRHTFGVGLKQFGLDTFLDKIFGPDGSFGNRSVFDLFKEKELGEIIKGKLDLPVDNYEKIFGEVFFEYMGNHLSSYQFDEKIFEDFFKDGRFVIPNIPALYHKVPAYVYQRFMLTVDQFYVIPTESGIPLLFDYKQPLYYYHKNVESSVRVEPGFFPEDRGGQYPDHVTAETDGHFAADKNLFAYMGVVIPFDQVIFGAGINRRCTLSLPLKVKLDLVVKDRKLKTHWTPVAPHEIYHFKYEPFTFLDSYANSVPQVLEEGYLPVRRVHGHEVERHYLHDAFGVGFDVRADYENDFGSWVDFFLKKQSSFREKFYYLLSNPHSEPVHVEVGFSHADHHATMEVDTEFSYHCTDEDWVIPHFREEGFEDYDRQRKERHPVYTCAVETDVAARGDKERKVHAVASWTRDLLMTFHKVDFFYDRNPFTSEETEDFKICGSSYLKYPKYDHGKFATLDTVGLEHTVKTELKVHFGKNCNSDHKLRVRGLITETEEQRQMEGRRDTPEHHNEYGRHYHECLRERERGIHYGQNCMEYVHFATTLHNYTLHVEHESLSDRFLNKTYLLDRVLQFMFYTHSDHNEMDVHNPVDEVYIEANFSTKLPVADVRVQKPTSNSNYYNVYLPHYVGFSSYPKLEDARVKDSFSDAFCSFEGDHVLTFDRYEYTLPPSECFKTVARDCSPSHFFSVLAIKVKHPKYHKSVDVFLGGHNVEAIPASDESDIIILVDGIQVAASVDEPYLQKEGDNPVPLFYVTFRDFYFTLHSEKYGIVVEYDGNAIVVKASPYYRSKLCGLCGSYNGQKYDGTKDSDGCDNGNEKACDYAIPSDICPFPTAPLVGFVPIRCPSEERPHCDYGLPKDFGVHND